jgi:hypothetical protein
MCTGTVQKEHVAQFVSVFINVCGVLGASSYGYLAYITQLVFTIILLTGFLVFVINMVKNMIQAVKAFKEFPEKFAEWKFGPLEKILLFPFYMMKKSLPCFKNKTSDRSKVVPVRNDESYADDEATNRANGAVEL